MIGRLHGTIIEKKAPELLLDVNGVGYEISLPLNCFFTLPKLNETTTIYTHFVVREDAQLLYGFTDQATRSVFRELIKVNGVGPKLALAILSNMNATDFMTVVEREDTAMLISLPGVGKKTADRLIIEMKDRLAKLRLAFSLADTTQVQQPKIIENNATEEALEALLALGYNNIQANKMIKQVDKQLTKAEDIIRAALKQGL